MDLNLQQMTGSSIGGKQTRKKCKRRRMKYGLTYRYQRQGQNGGSFEAYRSSSNMNAFGLNSTVRKLIGGKRMYQSSKKSRKHHKIGRYI